MNRLRWDLVERRSSLGGFKWREQKWLLSVFFYKHRKRTKRWGKAFPPFFCNTLWTFLLNTVNCYDQQLNLQEWTLHCCWLQPESATFRNWRLCSTKTNLTNRYQVDHHNKSVHKDARTQQYKHSTYSISSPSIFKQKIAGFFSTVPKPPLLTPTTDSRQKSAKIRSTQMFLCKQHLQTGQQGCYTERWNVFNGHRCHSNPSQEHLTPSLVSLSSFSVLGALFSLVWEQQHLPSWFENQGYVCIASSSQKRGMCKASHVHLGYYCNPRSRLLSLIFCSFPTNQSCSVRSTENTHGPTAENLTALMFPLVSLHVVCRCSECARSIHCRCLLLSTLLSCVHYLSSSFVGTGTCKGNSRHFVRRRYCRWLWRASCRNWFKNNVVAWVGAYCSNLHYVWLFSSYVWGPRSMELECLLGPWTARLCLFACQLAATQYRLKY